MPQKLCPVGISGAPEDRDLQAWLAAQTRILLVHDSALRFLSGLNARLAPWKDKLVPFSGFEPNPRYESVTAAVALFRREACDSILAIGGGSAIDVAKCVRLYSGLPGSGENGAFLTQPIPQTSTPFFAVPTTAGTGSEATRFAVIYYKGVKQSVTSPYALPDGVLLDPSVLLSLPAYQKKATAMDALCHAVESFWSVNSTQVSQSFAREAIRGIMTHLDGCLDNQPEALSGMLRAAHLAGKAINITQTTAGHAMCYKITSLFGCAHGHAAILCDRVLYPWMLAHRDRCTDPRGESVLEDALDGIGRALGGRCAADGAKILETVFRKLDLSVPAATEAQIEELTAGVNPDRLKNHPIALDKATIAELYHEILRQADES